MIDAAAKTDVIITDKIKKLRFYTESLCIYDFKDDPVISSLSALLKNARGEDAVKYQSGFYKSLLNSQKSLKHYISELILTNDNAFTKSSAAGRLNKLPQSVINGVKDDLKKLEALAELTANDISGAAKDEDIREILYSMPSWEIGEALNPLNINWGDSVDKISEYHRLNGYGIYAQNTAFSWRDGRLCPVRATDPITLNDLKNYEIQRRRVVENTESFISGHPANNVLLYGDRGTGKSSTVHSLLNKYRERGLRMIEIPKSAVSDLPLIHEIIHSSPMKFIIFIDDLSFDSNDSSFSELKAALEGSLTGRQENALIYATSNRRHLIKESFSDRENDINRNDIMQEQLSLSDRFGLTVTFMNPDKREYLDIVLKIAGDRGLDKIDRDKLCLAADRWAARKGGRSPRCAKQFIDYIESCELAKRDW